MRYARFNITPKAMIFNKSIVKFLMCFIVANYGFSQTPDLTSCAVNIMDGAQIETQQLQAYNNLILLQSGTSLRIKIFDGSTTFVHGYKELEEGNGFVKPILVIERCKKGAVLNIGPRITAKLGGSCKKSNQTNSGLNTFINGNQ